MSKATAPNSGTNDTDYYEYTNKLQSKIIPVTGSSLAERNYT